MSDTIIRMKLLRLGIIVGVFLFLFLTASNAYAAQSSSTNYKVNETQFGPGGLLNATSPNYKAKQSLGSTAGGRTSSANYGANAGFLTPNEPFLQMIVNPATINLGTLSSASTATGTATFSVRAYVDSGYVVLSMNKSPGNEEGKFLNSMTSAAASSAGTEQFGINLVQNLTSCATPAPANFGANPVPIPNSTFATGQASSGYNTCGLFKYNLGDTVAQTNANGWGETDYTISYIVNINTVSYAGTYTMTQDLVAVPTY
ncbi:MAG TPA: hypothetical protein VLF79_02370 [Candidatus Saccharimonadales bacterium]|nr:hypothetical protein [Candidatus Saccharimonadales bacterium]